MLRQTQHVLLNSLFEIGQALNRRMAAVASLGAAVAVPALVLVWLAGFPAIDHSETKAIADRLPPLLSADASETEKLLPASFGKDDLGAANESVSIVSDDNSGAVQETDRIVTASLADVSEVLPSSTPAEPADRPAVSDRGPSNAGQTVDTVEILDECFAVETCIDRYLWALYLRTLKQDTVKEYDRRRVTVRKKRKRVTVTKVITRYVEEDFTWKDRKAAERAGMSMADYVIGGVDPALKRKLFHMLHAAEEAGLSPGITSAFRDDYRQSIASGLKAADNRSYHGGSLRGGYGHGMAVDVVSVKGETRAQRQASSETFWKWIDAHGQEFGIGRPYLDRDAPHVAPIDGKEYAEHRPRREARR
jgi:hypothetical protein